MSAGADLPALNLVRPGGPPGGAVNRTGVRPVVAQTHGYAPSFRVGAVVLATAGPLVVVLLEHVTAKPRIAVAEVPAAGSITPSSL